MSTQNWGHLAQLDYSSVTRPSLPREGLACETSIAAKGEIATARFQSRAQYRIFLFRERSVILKSSACLPAVRIGCQRALLRHMLDYVIVT